MSRAQCMKALGIFLTAHDERCSDPHLRTVAEDRAADNQWDFVRMSCRSCGATVTRRREGEDWSATWHFPEHDVIDHPTGCDHDHRPHTHDEHGDVQLQLVK